MYVQYVQFAVLLELFDFWERWYSVNILKFYKEKDGLTASIEIKLLSVFY